MKKTLVISKHPKHGCIKFFRFSFFLQFIVVLFCSCIQLSQEEKIIKETLGKTVNIEMFPTVFFGNKEIPFNEFRSQYPYVSLVYLEDGCNPCYPKYIEWHTRTKDIDLSRKFTVLFIVRGLSSERFINNVLEFDPNFGLNNNRFYMVMDPFYKFLDNNPDINQWIIDKSFLIDAKNKVKLIGPPFASTRMTELFNTICQ